MSIEEILAAMNALIEGAQGRSLTDDEVTQYEQLEAQLAAAQRDQQVRARNTAYNMPVSGIGPSAVPSDPEPADRHPLEFTAASLTAVQNMIDQRASGRISAALTEQDLRGFDPLNAALTTGTYGAPRRWTSGTLAGPRLLHRVGGALQVLDVDAIEAEIPNLTLPAPAAGAAEGASLAEFDDSTAGSGSLARYGRFTDLTSESRVGTDGRVILQAHQLAIGFDLDDRLVTLVETDGGTAATTSGDVPADVRADLATVMANTAEEDASRIVIIANPADVPALEEISPTSAGDLAQAFLRFAGAIVYPTNSATSGELSIAHLGRGVVYLEAMAMLAAADEDVKTGVRTLATAVIGGYGTNLISDYVTRRATS